MQSEGKALSCGTVLPQCLVHTTCAKHLCGICSWSAYAVTQFQQDRLRGKSHRKSPFSFPASCSLQAWFSFFKSAAVSAIIVVEGKENEFSKLHYLWVRRAAGWHFRPNLWSQIKHKIHKLVLPLAVWAELQWLNTQQAKSRKNLFPQSNSSHLQQQNGGRLVYLIRSLLSVAGGCLFSAETFHG